MSVSTPQDNLQHPEDLQQPVEASSLPVITEQENSDQCDIEQPRGHLGLCSTIYSYIGSLSGRKNNSKGEPIEAEYLTSIIENESSREAFEHKEKPLILEETYQEVIVTETPTTTAQADEGMMFQNREYMDKVKELMMDDPSMHYETEDIRRTVTNTISHPEEATYAIERLHLNETLNNGPGVQGFLHSGNIERYSEEPYRADRVFHSGGLAIPRSSMKVGEETTMKGNQVWNNLGRFVEDHNQQEQYTSEEKPLRNEQSFGEPTEPRTIETSERKKEVSSSEGGSASTVYYGDRFAGQVSEFSAEEVEKALNLENKTVKSAITTARKMAQGLDEEGMKEAVAISTDVAQICRELVGDIAQGTHGAIHVEETVVTVEAIESEVQPPKQEQSKEKVESEKKIVNANVKKQVIGAKGGPRRAETQKPIKGKEQKETSVPRWKAPMDKKPLQDKKPNNANSRSNSTVRTQTESMPATKPKVQQNNGSIKVELTKQKLEICTKSSSAVFGRSREGLSNPKPQPLKRKLDDISLVQSTTLKQTKITTKPSDENNKIAMFKQPGAEKPKIEMTKLTVERKTIERGGLAPKENESEKKVVTKGDCVFCKKPLGFKIDTKTLSCTHKAHTKCYTAMDKKKNSKCPACNSSNFSSEVLKKGANATTTAIKQ